MIVRSGGLPWRVLLTAALAAVSLFLYWSNVGDRGPTSVAREPATVGETTVGETATRTRSNVGFASERRLDEHYAKHGGEFGRITRQDYLRQAQLLRDAPAGGPILETVRTDGVTTRFDRQTGAFGAYNRDGTIRTFFKPNDGERYFRRQAERGDE
jgi:pyocin large subunit-like protein